MPWTSSTAMLSKGKWYMRLPQKPDRRAVVAYTLAEYACVLIRHERACFLLNTYSYRNHPIGRHWHRFMTWCVDASSEWTHWERVES